MRLFSLFALIIGLLFNNSIHAGEGMWLPHLLAENNEAEMQAMGMRMTAEDIYSINQGSLKDAIVHFGGFCTSEIISSKGLLLTNHHCGYRFIQQLSTIEKNYVENGFWAMSNKEELAPEGIYARFVEQIEDVTETILQNVSLEMTEKIRQEAIEENISNYIDGLDLSEFQEAKIKPFYKGNQYILVISVRYPDVRLVGTPPESIGKFGADTDNWIWPRHTGDFSIFRIYSNADNGPAEYSQDNKPFNPKHFLPVSLDGVEEGDFTLVFGFPGSTDEYLTAQQVQGIVDVINPALIAERDIAMDIMDEAMRENEVVKLKYTSKFYSLTNSWKRWKGEIQGIYKTGAIEKKEAFEADFRKRLKKNKAFFGEYGGILPQLQDNYALYEKLSLTNSLYKEIFNRNVAVFKLCPIVDTLISAFENGGEPLFLEKLKENQAGIDKHFKDYDEQVEEALFGSLVFYFNSNVDKTFLPESIRKETLFMQGMNERSLGEYMFSKSALSNSSVFQNALASGPEKFVKMMSADPIRRLKLDVDEKIKEEFTPSFSKVNNKRKALMRKYMEGLMVVFPEKNFYPDANSTLRVSYGKVEGVMPVDAKLYLPISYLEGVMEKYVPGDYEFDVPQQLIDLYEQKDYGEFTAPNGKVPVCFIGSNHTTGGNSGSPAIDAWGNLVGLNFDRMWEGVFSDYYFDETICRNIMVDIRYVLFIIDKYGGAGYLIDEMELVRPKVKHKK